MMACKRLAAQIEEAEFEAQVFGVVRLAEDRHGQLGGFRQHLDFAHVDFDGARGDVEVDRLGRAPLDLAVDADHPLGAAPLGGLEGRAGGIDDDLRQAIVVAQIDEQQAAMVTHAVHPTRQARGLAGVGLADAAAGV